MQGMERHFTAHLNELLDLFPCVGLVGVRQSGKTTTLTHLDNNWQVYDLESASDFEVVARDPDLFLRLNPNHIALDEAQLLPDVFPALRVAIDANRNETGRFIITGSSSPELLRSISESLAGRVALLDIGPFSVREAYQQPASLLYTLIQEKKLLSDFAAMSPSGSDLQQQH